MKVDNLYKKPNGNIGVIVGQAPIENLVFEGGGPKGLVYVGALEVLDSKGILASIKNIGGSSAGAITALAIGLGNSAAQAKKIIYDLNIGEMTDLDDEEITGTFSGLVKVKEGQSFRMG